ncbi:MAG: hypothetical protein LKJ22_08550 [Liquorilactobacillus nagelii]|jgi:hypothetical protein|uniref:hypothetical protein n=1 Tax=Liquorilactobacillus nagelii TaxID=82688 RepID=UPI0024315D65|nr:hypothetical protein [Liquorilactobacillus nagelii]MCI1921956.1 hypothetical protein [Liquorilactobacillus nagelii]MCI1976396.1 hypothetical protein [Liquorilactobacillus nagelii]
MKTREELLGKLGQSLEHMDTPKMFHKFNNLTYSVEAVERILSAPTQEQLDCPYCHGGRKAKPIVETKSEFLAFDKSGIVAFGNDGSVTTGEDYTKIKYCPMCGRKLEE